MNGITITNERYTELVHKEQLLNTIARYASVEEYTRRDELLMLLNSLVPTERGEENDSI